MYRQSIHRERTGLVNNQMTTAFRRHDETLNWKNRTDDIPIDRWDRHASVDYKWPYPYPAGYDTAKPYNAWKEEYNTNPTCTFHTHCTSLLVNNSKDNCTRCVYINGGDYECANRLCNIPFV